MIFWKFRKENIVHDDAETFCILFLLVETERETLQTMISLRDTKSKHLRFTHLEFFLLRIGLSWRMDDISTKFERLFKYPEY